MNKGKETHKLYTKCGKCGSECIRIFHRSTCKDCLHNGFQIDDEVYEKLGEDDYDTWFYDEDLRQRAIKKSGMDIEREESEWNGSCEIGDAGGEGCWKFVCCECGELVDNLPTYTC